MTARPWAPRPKALCPAPTMAEAAHEPALLLWAHSASGVVAFYAGKYGPGVTFEEFKGLGHNCDTKDKPLKASPDLSGDGYSFWFTPRSTPPVDMSALTAF